MVRGRITKKNRKIWEKISIKLDSQEEWENTNNNMKVQILSNSEGSSPMKEIAQNGEISLLNEKNDLTKNLLLATDLDETVRVYTFIAW